MFGKTACELYRDVAFCRPQNLPPYNDENIQKAFEEVKVHSKVIEDIFRYVADRHSVEQAVSEEDNPAGPNWNEDYPEDATSIVVHHTSILRNKRLLLAYHLKRMDLLRSLRWQQRTLSDSVKENLSPAEQQVFKDYDKLLGKYTRSGENGIGLDLTLDMLPPRDPNISVRVLKDFGDVVLSIGLVLLQKGSVHLLPREEAEPLIRENLVQDISLERD